MTKASKFTKNAALERFLKRFPEDVKNSFTVEQLQAMQTALQATQWRRHPVDIRLTIPFLWKKFYFVLVAGPEQRSKQRRIADRSLNPIWTFKNLLFVMVMVVLGILISLGLFQLRHLSFDTLGETEIHPTSIPFKEGKQACQETGRTWENNECIDYTHDPTF